MGFDNGWLKINAQLTLTVAEIRCLTLDDEGHSYPQLQTSWYITDFNPDEILF